jgi:ribonucleoside-diphosphate reductase alpha chain
MPGLAEEIKKNVNRPVPELAIAEDTDVVELKSGNGYQHERRAATLTQMITNQQDAPSCPNCGQITVRNGACYKCLNCGESLGCS